MIKNRKLTRPEHTNSSEKQNSKGTTRTTLVVLLFAYISLSCCNEGLSICPKTFSLFSVPACYFVNIVRSIIVEEVHVHGLKIFETR